MQITVFSNQFAILELGLLIQDLYPLMQFDVFCSFMKENMTLLLVVHLLFPVF